jgi:hypothetical protein
MCYRLHAGDGRYIQHDQKIHRSVLKRLLYDKAVIDELLPRPNNANYRPFGTPKAHLPPSLGAESINYWNVGRLDGNNDDLSWDALLLSQNRNLDLWEGDV